MGLFAGFLVWVALLAFVSGLVLLLPRSKRLVGKRLMFGAVGVFIVAIFLADRAADDEAKQAGFQNNIEYRLAKEAGVTDPKVWQARVETDRANAAAAAEQAAKEAQAVQAAKEAAAKAEEEKCRTEVACWGEKHFIKATAECRMAVERLANYDFEWTDGWIGPKFSRYRWKNVQKGVVTYIGDSIKFQNGFGAFQNHIYTCDFDTLAGFVVDVSANPGRL